MDIVGTLLEAQKAELLKQMTEVMNKIADGVSKNSYSPEEINQINKGLDAYLEGIKKIDNKIKSRHGKIIYMVEDCDGNPKRLYYGCFQEPEIDESLESSTKILSNYDFKGMKYPTLIWVWKMNEKEKTFDSLPRWNFGYGKGTTIPYRAVPFRFKPALGYWEYDDKYGKES